MSEDIDDPELLAEFASESLDMLQDVSSAIIECENANDDHQRKQHLQAVFRSVHSIKGNSSFFGLHTIQELAHTMENLLDDLRNGKLLFEHAFSSLLLSGIDLLTELINGLSGGGQTVAPDKIQTYLQQLEAARSGGANHEQRLLADCEAVLQVLSDIPPHARVQVQRLLEGLAPSQTAEQPSTKKPEAVPTTTNTAAADDTTPDHDSKADQGSHQERRVMRIDEERIDAFLGYVGELVVIGDMFSHVLRRFQNLDMDREILTNLNQVTGTFHNLSAKLQSAIMSVRKVPVRQLLRKTPKLVRDIASNTGKQIKVVTSGEDCEIDKGYLDLLDAPLVHMVRNAADHGIEPPDQRQQAGKPEHGTISITVSEDNDFVHLSLADDGRGINTAKLAAKALDLGIIKPGEDLDHDALIECMFAAGVSTAETISDISGRGVGMDVVKRAIEQAGGRIAVETTPGQGSHFTISLPKSVTTQIGMGYFVRCGDELYILDLDTVSETFAADEKRHTSPDGAQIIRRRGSNLPLIDSHALLHIPNHAEEQVAVAIEVQKRCYALLVDEVVGIKQMVKLPLRLPGQANLPFQGVAMQGDGSLALVLDLEAILDLCQVSDPQAHGETHS